MGIVIRPSKNPTEPLKPTASLLDRVMTDPNLDRQERVPRQRGPKITLPKMAGVDSSHIRSCAWKDGSLFVRFRDRSVYKYGNETHPVPREIFEELQKASADEDSVGKVFREKVRDSYPVVKL